MNDLLSAGFRCGLGSAGSGSTEYDKIYPYLLRGREITRPNQVWAMDITYIRMARTHVRAWYRGPGPSTVSVVDKPQGLHCRTRVCSSGTRRMVARSRIGRPHTGQRRSSSQRFMLTASRRCAAIHVAANQRARHAAHRDDFPDLPVHDLVSIELDTDDVRTHPGAP
jgi:hypothetical protein